MLAKILTFAALAAFLVGLSLCGHGLTACAMSPVGSLLVCLAWDGTEYDDR